MAIAFDTSTTNSSGSAASLTMVYTVTGNNTFLAVTAYNLTGATSNITGITYNGVALTRLVSVGSATSADAWYLFGAASGTHNLVFSYSVSQVARVAVASWNGVKQSGLDAQGTSQESLSATTITSSVTPVAVGAWGICFNYLNAATFVSFTGGVERAGSAGTNGGRMVADSNGIISGLTAMGPVQSPADTCWAMTVSIAPASSAPNSNFLLFM